MISGIYYNEWEFLGHLRNYNLLKKDLHHEVSRFGLIQDAK